MKRIEVIKTILDNRFGSMPVKNEAHAFAPANIALCKYWGKRDTILNLPFTSSLSISLAEKGAEVSLSLIAQPFDEIYLNDMEIAPQSHFYIRLVRFLDLFRPTPNHSFLVRAKTNLPVSAGLASSACGFAALTMALNALFQWNLAKSDLSIIARLGSGSACRSLWHGFVLWEAGVLDNGMDSFAKPLSYEWEDLCIGLMIISNEPKSIGSRKAMKQTVETSSYYKAWPQRVNEDLKTLNQALKTNDFILLGETAEANALAMHACMLAARPPIIYSEPETINIIKKIWHYRATGLPVYFTQDAGANLKLLFLKKERENIQSLFSGIEIIEPFN